MRSPLTKVTLTSLMDLPPASRNRDCESQTDERQTLEPFGSVRSERAHAAAAIHSAFASSMNDILLIAAIIALTGSALSFALVRQKDFVASAATPEPVAA